MNKKILLISMLCLLGFMLMGCSETNGENTPSLSQTIVQDIPYTTESENESVEKTEEVNPVMNGIELIEPNPVQDIDYTGSMSPQEQRELENMIKELGNLTEEKVN